MGPDYEGIQADYRGRRGVEYCEDYGNGLYNISLSLHIF